MTGAPADTLATARTPALLLDEERLAANVKRMNERAAALRVQLRPHLKTAKCLEVARLIFGGAVGPITVSTLKEAEFFVAGGFADLLYAVGFAVDKLDAVEALRERGGEVTVVLDHPTMAEALAQRCADLTRPLAIMIEIDTDGHRAGLRPDDARLDGVVRTVLAAPGLTLRGIMTHAGESYTSASTEEMRYWARRERDGAVHAAVRLRALGVAAPRVSVGSTPTAFHADHLDGVDELRAGVYVFQDLFQAGLGVCAVDDIAITVLATVISLRPEQGWLIIDAGGLALSKDRSTAHQVEDQGYGRVCDLAGRPIGDLVVERADQEHGIVASRDGGPLPEEIALGDRLRVLPNHACMTAAAYDAYRVHASAVSDEGSEALRTWYRCNGW